MYGIGIDIGSTAAKAVVLKDGQVAFTSMVPTGFSSVDAAERLAALLADAGFPVERGNVVATGYGRVSVPYAGKVATEITCHGRGAAHLFGKDVTVVDIGGQDTKVIRMAGGKVVKFVMNDKCSAGTGKFVEVMANRLAVSLPEFFALARAGKPTPISSMCTVFAESEVISLIGRGAAREDIACGVVGSVVSKVATLVGKDGSDYVLTGGLCDEPFLVEQLSFALGASVRTCSLARYAGALGAAESALS